jgi:predicted nucleic acid-binding protein
LIVVDTSAWVELVRRTESPVHRRLDAAITQREDVAVTEVIVAEVLAGATSEHELVRLRQLLLGFPLLPLHGLAGHMQAAALARQCRRAGAALRRGITGCLVAVPAIEAGAPVLHSDRDFDVLARHTPLRVVPLDE